MMRKLPLILLLICMLLIGVSIVNAQAEFEFETFDDFIDHLDQIANLENAEEAQGMVDELWDYLLENERIPFVIEEQVAFLYRNTNATSVDWRGDFTGWRVSPYTQGVRLSEFVDLWVTLQEFPSDARLDYKIILDGNLWIVDPANPLAQLGGFGPNSELWMPDYVPSEWIAYQADINHGELSTPITIDSESMGYTINYQVYTPYGYDEMDDLPTLYVTDGQDYSHDDMGSLVIVLDNMLAEGLIEPLIAVFIDPRDPDNDSINRRETEFLENPDFAQFVAEELVQIIDIIYDTDANRESRATLGASFGGVWSLFMSLSYPDVFSMIGVQSPSVWALEDISLYEDAPMDYELDYFVTNGLPIWDSVFINDLLTILEDRQESYTYIEVPEGHSWGNWRALMDDMLLYFFAVD